MANKIQVKRGLKASIPALNVGEPGFTTDTKEFYIGSASGNVQLAKQADLSAHMADTAAHNGFVGKTQMFGTFDNFNDITQPGIYHGIIASPKESEPINGGTNPRRLTLTVRHIFWERI